MGSIAVNASDQLRKAMTAGKNLNCVVVGGVIVGAMCLPMAASSMSFVHATAAPAASVQEADKQISAMHSAREARTFAATVKNRQVESPQGLRVADHVEFRHSPVGLATNPNSITDSY
jgi:NAD(P)H-dependent FMN reductase